MLLKVIKRALAFYLTLIGVSVAAIGALLWYHLRLANPCPVSAPLSGDPATCFYRIQPTGDWQSAFVVLVGGLAVCLLISWLSFKFGRPSGEA